MMTRSATPPRQTRSRAGLLAMVLILTAPAPAAMATGRDEAAFDLFILGMRAGQFAYSAVETGESYAVNARLESSGIVRMIRRFSQDARAEGRRRVGRLEPLRYDRQSVFGASRSQTRMSYQGGVPRLDGDQGANPRPEWALNPASQRGTLDPLTAIYAVLREMPRNQACAAPLAIFDGTRRAEVVFAAPEITDDTIICAAEYRRVAGYAPDAMAEQTRFPFRLVFAASGAGRVRVERMQINSLLGPATLIRR